MNAHCSVTGRSGLTHRKKWVEAHLFPLTKIQRKERASSNKWFPSEATSLLLMTSVDVLVHWKPSSLWAGTSVEAVSTHKRNPISTTILLRFCIRKKTKTNVNARWQSLTLDISHVYWKNLLISLLWCNGSKTWATKTSAREKPSLSSFPLRRQTMAAERGNYSK